MRKRKPRTPESRSKASEAAKRRWADPEKRAKLLASRGKTNPAASEALKRCWADREWRDRQKAAVAAGRNTPEALARHKAKMEDPATRSKMSEGAKRRWARQREERATDAPTEDPITCSRGKREEGTHGLEEGDFTSLNGITYCDPCLEQVCLGAPAGCEGEAFTR